jgi:hypothetical protein
MSLENQDNLRSLAEKHQKNHSVPMDIYIIQEKLKWLRNEWFLTLTYRV